MRLATICLAFTFVCPLPSIGADSVPNRLPREQLLLYRDRHGDIQPVRTPRQWQKRREEIVRGMEKVMGPLPGRSKKCALQVQIESEEDCGAYIRRRISYASEPGSRVPAWLLLPKSVLTGNDKAPAALCLHPTGMLQPPEYARELATRGYVTLTPNYPLMGDYRPDLRALGWQSGTMKAIWDNLRGLDLLDSLPYVRHGKYGAIGHSLGGHNSVYTAIFDQRIQIIISSCGLDSYLDYYSGDPNVWKPDRGWCQMRYMPNLLSYAGRLDEIPFDFHELIGSLAPRPVLIVAPLHDANFQWKSVDRVVAAASRVYRLYGKADNLRVEHPDCEHSFPEPMRQLAYRLLDEQLEPPSQSADASADELRVGIAGHAFDHLGNIGEQAEAAAASGATIIYATGLGAEGYGGLPPAAEFAKHREAAAAYLRRARASGIKLALGYACATSLVKLSSFDTNWTADFRARFRTSPAEWLQQDKNGQRLPSWYGGDYQPACMNNPDWREYEKFIVHEQIAAGHDGIFFDNPTVHPQGCYCPHCMQKFAAFLNLPAADTTNRPIAELRRLAIERPIDFLRFRCTTARDFLAEIRRYARTLNPHALITCNNSLNSTDVLYSQCRSHAYNIHEMSQAEDLVVVEDQSSQPRVLADGRVLEYGPTYKQLNAISHGKPVVAVTIAQADYHTPPNLVRLAMAEAAANNSSYLMWPTWPENQRARMQTAIRPQADFLRTHHEWLDDARARRDAIVFLPFRRWIETDVCAASKTAAALSRANIQYEVLSEDNFNAKELQRAAVLVVENDALFSPSERALLEKFQKQGGHLLTSQSANWLEDVRRALTKPSLVLNGPATVRAVVRDQERRTIIHILNLNVERVSSFEDRITAAANIRLSCRVPLSKVRSVRAFTADAAGASGDLPFTVSKDGSEKVVETTLPKVQLAAMVVID